MGQRDKNMVFRITKILVYSLPSLKIKILFYFYWMLIFNSLPKAESSGSQYSKWDGKNFNVMWEISFSHPSKTFDFSLNLILRFLPEEFMVECHHCEHSPSRKFKYFDCKASLIHKAKIVFNSSLPTGALNQLLETPENLGQSVLFFCVLFFFLAMGHFPQFYFELFRSFF